MQGPPCRPAQTLAALHRGRAGRGRSLPAATAAAGPRALPGLRVGEGRLRGGDGRRPAGAGCRGGAERNEPPAERGFTSGGARTPATAQREAGGAHPPPRTHPPLPRPRDPASHGQDGGAQSCQRAAERRQPSNQQRRCSFFQGQRNAAYSIVWPAMVSPAHPVPKHIKKPDYVTTGIVPDWGDDIEIKNEDQIQGLRQACQLARHVLLLAGKGLKVGMTTEEIDSIVHHEIIRQNAYPSPLGYGGFPKSVCTSVNNVVCHGIPDSRPLQDGDIINIDVTVYYNGYHGDTSETFLVGNVDKSGQKLVEVARKCRDEAIAACRPGAPFSVIGNTIRFGNNYITELRGTAGWLPGLPLLHRPRHWVVLPRAPRGVAPRADNNGRIPRI
ncbi:methionine aminopeptidase 1D, mitochondrial isoform X3 [Rissa tridactyla]|nr:methionine aminopeptidase 1D, mitochondrial isoform X3 [Rissa tridactyla]